MSLVALSLLGCDLFNEEEQIPAYLYVEPFSFELDNPDEQGSASALIPYGWVYVDGVYYGAYELPAQVPVLAEGASEVIVLPGIRDNGSVITPQVYAFYERYEETRELLPGRTDTIRPITRYLDNLNFAFIENFEGGHPFVLDLLGNQSENMIIDQDPEPPFEGGAGRLQVNENNPVSGVVTQNTFVGIPTNGLAVYLELDYLTEVNLRVGLIAFDVQGNTLPITTLVLRPNEAWNKVYFSLASPLNDVVVNGVAFKIVISAELPVTNEGFTISEGEALVDNVKLIYF